jgi:hypothetical protein
MVIGPEHVRNCLLPHRITGCCNSYRAQPKIPNSKSGLQHRDDSHWTKSARHNSARQTDTTQPVKTFTPFFTFNFHGSMHLKNILIYIQQDATLHSLFYLETALHVSGGTSTHHQERKQLYLQHLVFVTPLLLPAAMV